MSKGDWRRPTFIEHSDEAANWMLAFGDKWETRDAKGNVLSTGSTHDRAVKKALDLGYDGFAIVKVKG